MNALINALQSNLIFDTSFFTHIYLLCYCIEQKNTSINYFYLFEKHSVSISSDIQFPQSDPAANRIFNWVCI